MNKESRVNTHRQPMFLSIAVALFIAVIAIASLAYIPSPIFDTLLLVYIGSSTLVILTSLFMSNLRRLPILSWATTFSTLVGLALKLSMAKNTILYLDTGEIFKSIGWLFQSNIIVGGLFFLLIASLVVTLILKTVKNSQELVNRTIVSSNNIDKANYNLASRAMLIVKWDAIGSLIIPLATMMFGLIVGALVHHIPLSLALTSYYMFTIGNAIPFVIPTILNALLLSFVISRLIEEKTMATAGN